MQYPEYNSVEVSFNGPNNRNVIMNIANCKAPEHGSDHYYCIFRYTNDIRQHVDETGSVKGHTLPGYADYIYFDIDRGDLTEALESTRQLFDKICYLGVDPEMVAISFSGNKGFHLTIPSEMFGMEPDKDNHRHMKTLAKHIADGIEIDTAIYDRNRLFRFRNSKHGKSRLFKVDISHTMLSGDIEAIKEYAKQPQPRLNIARNVKQINNLVALWEKSKESKKREIAKGQPGTIEIPRNQKACIHRILHGVSNGIIHNAAFRVANHFYKLGYPASVIQGILEGWGPLNEVPAEEDFKRMAEEAGQYDFGCKDEILHGFCDEKCHLFRQQGVDVSKILTLEAQVDIYKKHVRTLDKTRFITGFEPLDTLIRGVAPGEVMMISAYSGLFKSAWLQNLLLSAGNRTGVPQIFFSLEMPSTKVFERTTQIICEEYSTIIENGFKNDHYAEKTVARLKAAGADKMLVVQDGGLTIEQVEQYALAARDLHGTIGAIGIDYLGLMGAAQKSEYDRISYVAENSKHLAKRINAPVIVLTQINRGSAKDGEMEKWSAKGSGAVEASADYMLGLIKNDDDTICLKVLKNRNGEENISFEVEIDKPYLKFKSLTPMDSRAIKAVAGKRQPNKRRDYNDDLPDF